VREFLSIYSTPGTSLAHTQAGNQGHTEGGSLPELDSGSAARRAPGYQPHERTALDVQSSTHALCLGYNPENQGGGWVDLV